MSSTIITDEAGLPNLGEEVNRWAPSRFARSIAMLVGGAALVVAAVLFAKWQLETTDSMWRGPFLGAVGLGGVLALMGLYGLFKGNRDVIQYADGVVERKGKSFHVYPWTQYRPQVHEASGQIQSLKLVAVAGEELTDVNLSLTSAAEYAKFMSRARADIDRIQYPMARAALDRGESVRFFLVALTPDRVQVYGLKLRGDLPVIAEIPYASVTQLQRVGDYQKIVIAHDGVELTELHATNVAGYDVFWRLLQEQVSGRS